MKKNKFLLISWILSGAYVIYLVSYFSNAVGSTGGAEQAGSVIATALITPHLVVTAIGLLFNILAWAMNRRGFALVAGILYAVAMILFPVYFFFVLIQMILSFVAYAKMKPSAVSMAV